MKIEIIRKSRAVIEVNKEDYPEEFTEEQMLELDKANIKEDPSIMEDWLTDDEITVKIIK